MPPATQDLYAETHGGDSDPAVVLIAGLASQLTWWPMGFVQGIVVGGYRVVRFDNRDIGLSRRTAAGKINLDRVIYGEPASAPYTIETMADDTIRLLDVLEIGRAHVIGHSMGGMIAQAMAAAYPDRVITLTSLMSTTGRSDVGRATVEGARILYKPLPGDTEDAIAQSIADYDVWATPDRFDRAANHALIRHEYGRGYDAAGVGRQIAAIRASGDRTPSLSRIVTPTLVIHGTDDPLIDVMGGRSTAEAIAGAHYVELEGVAHGLPYKIWPVVLRHIHRHLARGAE